MIVHTEEDFNAWVAGMHTAADPPAAGSAEASGKSLFAGNCSSCHTNNSTSPGSYAQEISSQQARWNGWVADIENSAIVSAPNLTHFGTRSTLAAGIKDLTHESLVEWITDPSAIKIGTRMQDHAAIYNTADGKAKLTANEISDIAAYLLSLKPGSGSGDEAIDMSGGGDVDAAELFTTNCSACHSTGNDKIVGPGLAGVGDRAGSRVSGLSADEYLEQSLREPDAFIVDGFTPGLMPNWEKLGDDSIDALVTYLKTLK